MQFDAILAFDVVGVGGLAWRLGRILKIPASGWVTGNTPASSSYKKMVKRALNNLDLVFYQSHDLLDKAGRLLGMATNEIPPDKHIVLPRGIPAPPSLPKEALRQHIRKAWGIPGDHVLVLSLGRIHREKGIWDLLRALGLAAAKNPKITCVIVGSSPAFDETHAVQKSLEEMPTLRHHIKLLPACSPDQVWEYLCAADIFAFTSHHEGMPNSLLEAMAMEVPAIAFAIPPVVELEGDTGGIMLVPPFDATLFGEALVRLAAVPNERSRMAVIGRNRIMERFMVRKNLTIALEQLVRMVCKKRMERGST
jgi:glycosyltransferase involved in cell wall biosynthesis